MMHIRLPIPAFLRDHLPLGRRLWLMAGGLLPIGVGLAGLVVLAGLPGGGGAPPSAVSPSAPAEAVATLSRAGESPQAEPMPVAAGAAGQGARMSAGQELAGPVAATILRVPDGDTLGVTARIWLGQEVQVLVRLRGVDAPEKNGACAAEKAAAGRARDRLAALSGGPGAVVMLTAGAPDKYNGRVIADVAAADGTDLAAALLGDGLVRRYEGGRRLPWCGS